MTHRTERLTQTRPFRTVGENRTGRIERPMQRVRENLTVAEVPAARLVKQVRHFEQGYSRAALYHFIAGSDVLY